MTTHLSPLAEYFEESLEATEYVTGAQTFTWKGKEVPCVPTSIRVGTVIAVGGAEREISLTLIVRRSNFLTADSTLVTVDSILYTVDNDTPTPVSGKKLVFRGATYRIGSAREASPRGHYELDLIDPDR